MKQITINIMLAVAVTIAASNGCRKKQTRPMIQNDLAGSYIMTGLSIVTPAGEINYMPGVSNSSQHELLTLKYDKTYSYNGKGLNATEADGAAGMWDYNGGDSLLLNGFPISIVSRTNSELVLLADRSDDGLGLVFKTTYQKLGVS